MRRRDEIGGWEMPRDGLDLEAARRPRVVVFDVDGVLCAQPSHPTPSGAVPEAMRVDFHHEGRSYPHVFIPHLDALLELLVAWGARVCFFSSAIPERNHAVLGEVLTRSFAPEVLAAHRRAGQFVIHSRDALRDGDRDAGETGNKIKDMRRVIGPGEALEDVVLVEDQPSYTALGQEPCLRALDVEFWRPGLEPDEDGWSGGGQAYRMNAAAWLLGVFDLLLHDVRYRYRPLRLGLDRLLFDLYGATRREARRDSSHAQHGVILRGLTHLWRTRPEVVFHGRVWRPDGAWI